MYQNLNYTIKHISATEAYTVRHPVLRKGKPIDSCVFDGDNLSSTFHLGVFIDNKLIGVCSFFKYNHQLLTEEFQYQLRGMAVLNTYQNKGLGNVILNYGETLLKEKNMNVIWCNAREKALNFYKKMGYESIGEPFNIKDIGLHYVMWKKL